MFHLRHVSLRNLIPRSFTNNHLNKFSSNPTVVHASVDKLDSDTNSVKTEGKITNKPVKIKELPNVVSEINSGQNLVAAVFASLKEDKNDTPTAKGLEKGTKQKTKNSCDAVIAKADDIDLLLNVVEENVVLRRHALKIVSILSEWSSSGRIKQKDFENDPRFLKICRLLGRNNISRSTVALQYNSDTDLSTVLSVTGDDEAAKLIANISLPQTVKVMSSLAQRKRRSTPLLRSLAFNISRNSDRLNLKECADLLFGAATLNFPDLSLLTKTCADTCVGLSKNKDKSAVVGSILTSLGLLRYKEPEVLNALSDWILQHNSICRSQDVFSLFITLAVVSHHPPNAEELYKTLIPQIKIEDASKSSVWLDYVWSLVVLNVAESQHIASVLNPDFISRLQSDCGSAPLDPATDAGSSKAKNVLDPAGLLNSALQSLAPIEDNLSLFTKVKLLNINAAAQYFVSKYSGPKLSDTSVVNNVKLTRTKEKQALVTLMVDSLGSLLPSVTYLNTSVDTGMGFLIDAECVVDKNCNPLPVADSKNLESGNKIAFIVHDYHDLCKGHGEPIGLNVFAQKLLKANNYKVITVPYTEFSPYDKLVQRVRYLETKIKNIVKCTN